VVKLIDTIGYTSRGNGQKDRIEIDKEGNIYQLLPKKDGVYILKWKVR
jgi:hypothetical protein